MMPDHSRGGCCLHLRCRHAQVALILALCIGSDSPSAQIKPRPLALALGHPTEIKGAVRGYAGASYIVHGEAGEYLRLSLRASTGATHFNVYDPSTAPGGEALFRGELAGNLADLKFATSGDYRIDVFQMRSAARRGTMANFTLEALLRK